ncbi:hypothetical protein Clacol_005582 [Clathrus columnatus]|uniref:Transcriptional regulator of RNA polII, SAGA, subunit-domain-containing protein n=1 Tax=Clathrus columnatus TaxID=1419009 RepID=A0AAV5AHD7_9AGAM|nr:hypothetical protein Clacol_005582 [Clathrus columnatus]
MSMEKLNSTIIRAKLANALGPNRRYYWSALSAYLNGEIPRSEFDETIRGYINTPDLAQLHNTLIIALLSSATIVKPPSPPPDPNPRRKRSGSSRGSHLKTWIVGMNKKERERVKALEGLAAPLPLKPRMERDEIAKGRAVRLFSENPSGLRNPRPLCSITRGITEQSIAERVAFITAQNNLTVPQGSSVPQLILLALEAKLKHLVTHAISLTSTSRTISSIRTLSSYGPKSLSIASFDALFTVAPAVLPYRSAAALRLSLSDHTTNWEEEEKRREERTEGREANLTAVLRGKGTIWDAVANKGR